MNTNRQEALPTRVMTPDPVLRRPLVLIKSMLSDLTKSHGLAYRLFLRDVKARFRNSILGYIWLFLPPLATTLAFVFLNKQKVIQMDELPIAYPAYAMLGTLLAKFRRCFAGTLTNGNPESFLASARTISQRGSNPCWNISGNF